MELYLVFFTVPLFYFAPSFIACQRHHANTMSIFIVNLFLGWTLIGWVVALSWACTNKK